MFGIHTPPVVRKDVECAQYKHEENGRPFGFEANGYHSASGEAKNGDKETGDGPLTLKNESEEEEDKEDATCKKEAR